MPDEKLDDIEVEVEIPDEYKAPDAEPEPPAPDPEPTPDPEPEEDETPEAAVKRILGGFDPLRYSLPGDIEDEDRFDAAKAAAHAVKIERMRTRMLTDVERQVLDFGIPDKVARDYIAAIENYEVEDIKTIAETGAHISAAKTWAYDNPGKLTRKTQPAQAARTQPRATPVAVAPKPSAPKFSADEVAMAKTFAKVHGGTPEEFLASLKRGK